MKSRSHTKNLFYSFQHNPNSMWIMRVITFIWFLLFLNNFRVFAEGTSSIAPSNEDAAALYIGAGNTGGLGGDYGQFAWKGSASKLSFNIQNTCEKVYFGFSAPKKNRTLGEDHPTTGGSNLEESLIFRILDPFGNPINNLSCFGNIMIEGEAWQTLRSSAINLQNRAETDAGPRQLGNPNGYDAFELDLSACGINLTGDYSIEFYTRRTTYDPNTPTSGFFIEYFDITVGSCNSQALTGRLWSNNWCVGIKRDGDGSFDRAFNGAFYVCSKEGFITKIDFNTKTNNRAEAGKNTDIRSGFRAGAFNVSFNTTGPNNTGNVNEDRKSLPGLNSPNPELAVFLNLPDPSFCPPQAIGDFKAKSTFLSGCPSDRCFNLAFSKLGQIEVLLEKANGNRIFDQPNEVRFVAKLTEANRVPNPEDPNYPYEICIPWDGKDGYGNPADFSDISISGFYFQAIYHFPVYDAEFNDDGFIVETVRPALGIQELFYDDRLILNENNTGQSKDGTNGCAPPCHRWTGEWEDYTDKTQVYGNFNTINSWWFGNSTYKDFTLVAGNPTTLICPPDYVGCPGDDISPNLTGNASVTTSNPDCTVIEYADLLLSESNCSEGKVIQRKWTVYLTGLEAEKMECYQTISLIDDTAPVLVGVPAPITVLCQAIPSPPNNVSATDDCNLTSELTIAYNEEKIVGNCPGNYQLRRTWTATDRCGNAQTAEQLITVVDDTAPVLVGVPAPITVLCEAIPSPPNNVSATDNCNPASDLIITYAEEKIAGNCPGNYQLKRTWVATDPCGNATSSEQLITVVDQTAPVLANIPNDITVSCDAIPVPATTVIATDNCSLMDDITISFVEENIASNCAGNFIIKRTWIANDACGNRSTQTQTIQVEDTDAPVLENIPANITVSCDAIPAAATTVTATDNCSLMDDITISFAEENIASNCAGNFIIKRTWTANDACGNRSTQTQTIQVEDTDAPVLENIPADITVSCDAIPAVATIVTATDNCASTNAIRIDLQVEETAGACNGNYTIKRTWVATDPCGNSATEEQIIMVIDTTAPTIIGMPKDLVVSCDAIPVASSDVTTSDNCVNESAINLIMTEEELEGNCSGNFTIKRTWTATDPCGNQATEEQIITVIDTTAPIIIGTPEDLVVSCDAIPLPSTEVTANDNCANESAINLMMMEEELEGSCAGNYTIKRTWTATDPCGNKTIKEQIITVIDTTAPTIIGMPEDMVVSCDAIPVASTAVTASDNCVNEVTINLMMLEERLEGDCAGNYTIKRTWTATDPCGNSNSSTQTIQVEDNTGPILSGVPADVTVECDAVPNPPTVTATDNCEAEKDLIITFKEIRIDGKCPGDYTLKRAWTATDLCGNVVLAEQTITVADNTAPEFLNCPDDMVVLAEENCQSANLNLSLPEITDNCDQEVVLTSSVDLTAPFPMGTTTVIFTATDHCGNVSTCQFTIKVENAPQNTCPADIIATAICDADGEKASVSWEPPSGNECCSSCSVNTSIDDFIYLGERGGHRYYLSENSADWARARHLGDDLGGYLAVINDPAENAFLNSFLVEETAYIGLTNQGNDGAFYWQNEDALNYTNWEAAVPNDSIKRNYFTHIGANGKWIATNGSDLQLFIVEIPCMEVIQIEGPLNGSAIDVGKTIIRYAIEYDNCSNPDTCSFVVEVNGCPMQEPEEKYCETSVVDTTCFWIDRVRFSNIDNVSGNDGGFGDYTDLIGDLYSGTPQVMTLYPGFALGHTFNVYWMVWIDFDQNGSYEEEELIFTAREYRPIEVNLVLPPAAKEGITRMRIAMNFVEEFDACELLQFGEVEEYSVNIQFVEEGLHTTELSKARNKEVNQSNFRVLSNGNYPQPLKGFTPMDLVASKKRTLKVYPNPVKDKLVLEITNNSNSKNNLIKRDNSLRVINPLGQVVWSKKCSNKENTNFVIDVSNLQDGIYFIHYELVGAPPLVKKFTKN